MRLDNSKNLLDLVGTEYVQKTDLTKKVTFNGETKAYPVYKVRLDALYYNDQNDRIATWITRYKSEEGNDSLSKLSNEEYNDLIENFIYQSNPDSIVKTQKNIELIGQRESGVALVDGRIVDGNRRYTCLRRIQKNSTDNLYFETVIIDVDIQKDKKQIKLLELAIQHGEEKKVDYDSIDYAIGTYRDIRLTKLLTIDEYALSANEKIKDVQNRIDIATLICEYLDFIGLSGQYHIARESQVYNLFFQLIPQIKKLDNDEKIKLKTIVFNNILLKALIDQRKFSVDIKHMIKNDTYSLYFDDLVDLNNRIKEAYSNANINSKAEIDKFVLDNEDLQEELQFAHQKALLRSRRQQLKAKPVENVAKSVALMTEFDSRIFNKMSDKEKNTLQREMENLSQVVESYHNALSIEKPKFDNNGKLIPIDNASENSNDNYISDKVDSFEDNCTKKDIKTKEIKIAYSNNDKPIIICKETEKIITTLSISLSFGAVKEHEKQLDKATAIIYFVDNKYNIISDKKEVNLKVGKDIKCSLILNGCVSEIKEIYLLIKYKEDNENEAQRLIPFKVDISFGADFDL